MIKTDKWIVMMKPVPTISNVGRGINHSARPTVNVFWKVMSVIVVLVHSGTTKTVVRTVEEKHPPVVVSIPDVLFWV